MPTGLPGAAPSGSMIPKLKKLSESAHAALAELRNGDRASVMVFGSKSRVVLPFTDDLNAAEMAVNGVTAMRMGGTHIVAAINDAAMLFMKEQRTQRRRAVIMVTDNHGQISGKKNGKPTPCSAGCRCAFLEKRPCWWRGV